MEGLIWVIDKNYAEFALVRKFLVACNCPAESIVQFNNIGELDSSEQLPTLIFIDNALDEIASTRMMALFSEYYSKVPIILLADNEDMQTLELVAQIGAQDYLVKAEITLPLFRKSIRYAQDRKHILNQLNQSKDDYIAIFRDHPLPMWVYDVDTLAFIAVNDAAVHYYGYSEKEFLSMTIRDIRPSEDLPKLQATVSRNYKSGFYDHNQWRHIKKNGEELRVHIYSHNIEFDGRECKMVTSVNISREYALDRKLQEMGVRVE